MTSKWKGVVYKFFLLFLMGIVVGEFVLILETTGEFHTAALYVGVPTFIAALIIMLGAKTASGPTGRVLKWTAVALLLSMPLFGVGAVCVLMASPIIFAVAALTGLAGEGYRKNKRKLRLSIIFPALAILSIEGTTEFTTMDRFEVVSVERIVPASAEAVEDRLAAEASFDQPLPLFLRLFPKVIYAGGAGLDPGDRRSVRLVGKRFYEIVDGNLVFEVAVRESNRVRFVPVQDTTMIAHWLTWRYSEVAWQPVDDQHTRVTWTLAFQRELDPFWYFAPLERYGVSMAAEALIDNVATPRN